MKKNRVFIASLVATLFFSIQPSQAVTTIVGVLSSITVELDQKTVNLVPPTTNSPGIWTVTLTDPTIATASGLTLTLLKTGSTGITFTIAASGEYGSVSRSTQLYVQPGTPTLTGFSNSSVSLGQKNFIITPPISGSAGTWSYTSSDSKIASIIGSTVTVYDAGQVIIKATQAANSQWKTASTSMLLTITALTPIVGTFTNLVITLDSVASVNLVAPTSTSSGPWVLTSSQPTVASISGLILTPRAIGTTVVTAAQVPWGSYRSTSVTMTVTVLAALPTTLPGNFVNKSISLVSNSTNTITLASPTSNSSGLWAFSSSDTAIATISANTLTPIKPGKVTVTATQKAAGNYGPSLPLTMELTVLGSPTYAQTSDFERLVGDINYTFQFPASPSAGAWSIASSDIAVVLVQGNLLKFIGAGTAVITIKQSASDFWLEGISSFKVRVIGQTPIIGTFGALEIGVGQRLTPAEIKHPTSSSVGTWGYESLDSKIAQVVDGGIVGIAPGQTLISATQNPSGMFGQSKVIQTTITVKSLPVVSDFSNLKITLGTVASDIQIPTSDSSGKWSFTSSDPAILDVVNGYLQMKNPGLVTVTASQASTANFAAATKSFTVEVLPAVIVKAAPVLKPSAKVSISKRTITIKVLNVGNSAVGIYIDGKKAKAGKNKVKAGKRIVKVNVGGKRIFLKTYVIK